METLTEFSWLGIAGICIGLFIITLIILLIRSNTPEHYDGVLERAKRLEAGGDRKRAIEHLQKAINRLAAAENRKLALDVRLSRLRVSCGKMLEASGARDVALSYFRDAITTPHAESESISEATVSLLGAQSTEPGDLQHFINYAERAPHALAKTDPFAIALNEGHFQRMLQNSTTRTDTAKLAAILCKKSLAFPWLLRIQAQELVRAGDKAQAANLFRQILDSNQATRDDRRTLAQMLVERGDAQSALKIYQQLTAEADASVDDFRNAGLTALQICERANTKSASVLDDAADWLIKAAESDKSHAPTWAALGRVRKLQNKNDLAREAYQHAVQNQANDVPARLALADILLELKLPAQALPHLMHAAEIVKNGSELWLRCGKLAIELGDEDAALKSLENSIACKPVITTAVLHLAEIRHRRGDHARVVELLDEFSDLPIAMLPILGRSLAHTGKNKKAIEHLRAYSRSNSADQQVKFELGMLYGRVHNWKSAAKIFESLTDAQLKAKALPYHAYVCLKNQDLATAAQLVKKARDAELRAGLIHHVAAALAEANRDFAQARAEWVRALQADPALAPALQGYARLCEAQKDYASAIESYSKLQKIAPNQHDLAARIGICHIRAGNFSAGAAILQSAKIDANEEALECLIYGCVKLKQWNQAEAALARLPNRGRRAAYSHRNAYIVGYHLAQEAYSAGDYKRSVSLLETLTSQQTDQSTTTRSSYAAQTALISSLLPPSSDNALRTQLRTELQRLAQIAPTTFIARVLPALLNSYVDADALIDWKSFNDVRPTDWAQTLALAVLAIIAGRGASADRLIKGIEEKKLPADTPWQFSYLRAAKALREEKWSEAFEQLQLCITSKDHPADSQMPSILRAAAGAAAKSGRTTEAHALLQTLKHDVPDKHYLLGILLMLQGNAAEALAALQVAGPNTHGASKALQIISLAAVRESAIAGNETAALDAIEKLSTDQLTQPEVIAAKLDLHLSRIEAGTPGANPRSIFKSLRSITAELVLQPRFLRRAAILASRAAITDKGSAAETREGYRFAAALWATALESDCVWNTLDAIRTKQGLPSVPQDKRAALTETARQKLLAAIHARSTSGWSKDDVDLNSAWVEYEFTCSSLFAESRIGFALSGWVKGLTIAPYFLMSDDAKVQATIMLRRARESIIESLAQINSQPQVGPQQKTAYSGAQMLGAYLKPGIGFAEYLLNTNRPALALLHLDAAKDSSEAAQRIRARAIAEQAAILSASSADAKDALRMFEQAASLKADLSDKRQNIVQAAVALSRNLLNSQPGRPDAALQPIEIGRRLAGNHADLNSATAAVYVRQAIQFQQNENLEAAEQKLRAALSLSNEKSTRDLFAGLLAQRANQLLYKRQLDQALNLMRESLRAEGELPENEIDYRARCDLQQELISTGVAIAADDDAGIREVEIALVIGQDARRILDDEDARNFLGEVHREMGRLYGNQKNWDRAIEHLERAIEFKNTEDFRKMLARYLFIRGATSWDAGYRASGARDINKAYSLDPSNPDIRRAWSMVP